MKYSTVRGITVCLAVFSVFLFANSLMAQGKGGGKGGGGNGGGDPPVSVGVGYRAVWPSFPAGSSLRPMVRDFKRWEDAFGQEHIVAVGFHDQPYSGFLYDHTGLIDPNQPEKRFWELTEIAGPIPNWVPLTHTSSIIYSFNTSGIVAGIFRDPLNTEDTTPFYFDLNDAPVVVKRIPVPAYAVGGTGMGKHLRVNELGDILVGYQNGVVDPVTEYEAFIYNPNSNGGAGEHIRLLDSDGSTLQLSSSPKFNSSRNVVGQRLSGDSTVRFPIGGGPNDYFDFADTERLTAMNESSEFVCRVKHYVKRNRYELRAARFGQDVFWTAPADSYPHDLNNSGDVLMEYAITGDFHLQHEGDPNTTDDELHLNVRSMLVEDEYPSSFQDPRFGFGMGKLTDRDSTTGFPWIEGVAVVGTNADGSDLWGWFILIPEILP